MKYIYVLACCLLLAHVASAQDFTISDDHSSIAFSIKNFGVSSVSGKLFGLKGKGYFDANNLAESRIEASVDANTINTDNTLRDRHLREKTDLLEVAKYPLLELSSASIKAAANNQFTFTGKLTIKGKSKDISFLFTATPASSGYSFEGKFTINRKDFDIDGGATMGDEIKVEIKAFGKLLPK